MKYAAERVGKERILSCSMSINTISDNEVRRMKSNRPIWQHWRNKTLHMLRGRCLPPAPTVVQLNVVCVPLCTSSSPVFEKAGKEFLTKLVAATSVNDENNENVRKLVTKDRRLAVHIIAHKLQIIPESVRQIVAQYLLLYKRNNLLQVLAASTSSLPPIPTIRSNSLPVFNI
ncbi:hypothetical protein TNCV_4671901 [Trichonephila clavipes]|nr:hypothetical protein TNCV_4671901 [Trichonephila clavipes]